MDPTTMSARNVTSSSSPAPMAIPHPRSQAPPPPLPPPTHIPELEAGQDPGWQWGNLPNHNHFAPPVKSGSSLLGQGNFFTKRPRDDHDHVDPLCRKDRTASLMSDDGRANGDVDVLPPRSAPSTELTGERDLRQRAIEQSSHSYDKQLVNRIGGPNTPKRQSIPYSPNGVQENGNADRRSSSIWSLTMPERRHLSVDSTSTPRWPPGAVSPRSTSPWMEQDISERSASQRHGSAIFDYGSQRGSYDYSMFVHDVPQPEDGQMSSLNLHDTSPGSPKAGSKRRASSPPRERGDRSSLSSTSTQQDLPHRNSIQTISSRTSPSSRFHPNHSSLSSVSSGGPRHGSMGSSLGVSSIPSSATSYGSGGISPCLSSPAQDTDGIPNISITHGLVSNTHGVRHQRTASDHASGLARRPSVESISHSRSTSLGNGQGLYVCECCPKRPAKFESEEDLRFHENEKQYTCTYCKKRFKNKNEAERHQNSVHLRRQSWCCAALSSPEAAFHPSTSHNADVCGYCGQEFSSNPPQWERRVEHLTHAHKFGECNQSKKFFRADHFRQHLKHSHHGTSGKWTNVLENACVKFEPAPTATGGEKRVAPPPAQAPPALMITTTGLGPGPPPPAPDSIAETPHDS